LAGPCPPVQRLECSPVKNPGFLPLTPQQHPLQKPGEITLRVLLYGMLVLSLAQFSYRVSACFGTYFSVDMPLFLQVAYDYLANHVLYIRATDLPQYYQPGAGVYKYPPLFQLTLVPWFAQGWPEDVYFTLLRVTMLLMYLVAATMIARKTASLAGAGTSPHLFYASAAITALWFIPFHASHGVVVEIFVLCLASLFVCFYSRHTFLSGFWLGMATMLKIYPVFLLLIPLTGRNHRNLAGFIAACIISTLLTIAYFGLDENIFFFFKLLPILLSEHMSQYGSNMNIEVFLRAKGVISQSLPLFNVQRLLVLSVLAAVAYRYRNDVEKNIMLLSSLWVCAMLLCLSNYWLQYQLMLILPLIVLLGHAIHTRSHWQLASLSLVIITMSIDDNWSDILFRQAMEQHRLTENAVFDMMKSNGLLHTWLAISPVSMLLIPFSVLKVFVPHVLLAMATWILLIDRSGKKPTGASKGVA
jgi:hypothetical protein